MIWKIDTIQKARLDNSIPVIDGDILIFYNHLLNTVQISIELDAAQKKAEIQNFTVQVYGTPDPMTGIFFDLEDAFLYANALQLKQKGGYLRWSIL
jgi:hypothetical protein